MMQSIIQATRDYAIAETEQYGSPKREHLDLSFVKGQELASKLGADKDIVALGTLLMDIKIGQCISEGKVEDHVVKSIEASKSFLQQYNLDQETIDKILSCVALHHGAEEYPCREAEICANADCYRFLHPKGFISAIILFGRRDENTENTLRQLEKKLEEKHQILSLDICKQELEPYYQEFKNLIQESNLSS